jgi:hypothetical protein
MILEARTPSCFSSEYVLKADGRPVGKYEGRWFSESLDIQLTGRRKLTLQKLGWFGSEFVLKREEPEAFHGHADRAGFFPSSWNLDLSAGPAELVKAGWFGTDYEVRRQGQVIGRVDRVGWCERGWIAEGADLAVEDLLLVGLVFHIIIQRRQRAAAAHGGHAAGS